MGCFQSKKDNADIHPNVFRVVNIDESGADLWSGQLEVTENDLILYREGRDATVWPLRCLRRYGFDGEIFSFESGRRCDTGEGIYAFRCRRAGMLFRTLQQNIQLRNVISDSLPFQLPINLLADSPTAAPRQTLQASIVHRSSIDNGQAEHQTPNGNNVSRNNTSLSQVRGPTSVNQSPRSPSSVDILEVMPLYPRPQNPTNHVTNVYQTRDFKSREHNNNQAQSNPDAAHLYCNDFNRDLAMLRTSLKQEAALNTIKDIEDENQFMQSLFANGGIPVSQSNVPLSPTSSTVSEHYAQLSIEQQETPRLYMNMVPLELSQRDFNRPELTPTTPLTPKQVDYCNFNMNMKMEINSYANLSMREMMESINTAKQMSYADHTQKFSESDTFTSLSPVEELEVNYAVLDIDNNKELCKIRDLISPEGNSYASSKNESSSHCSSQRGRLVSQNSTERMPNAMSVGGPVAGIGYTTIDFDKTVALTSVATGTDIDTDGCRKTRHNSVNLICTSPIGDKGKSLIPL